MLKLLCSVIPSLSEAFGSCSTLLSSSSTPPTSLPCFLHHSFSTSPTPGLEASPSPTSLPCLLSTTEPCYTMAFYQVVFVSSLFSISFLTSKVCSCTESVVLLRLPLCLVLCTLPVPLRLLQDWETFPLQPLYLTYTTVPHLPASGLIGQPTPSARPGLFFYSAYLSASSLHFSCPTSPSPGLEDLPSATSGSFPLPTNSVNLSSCCPAPSLSLPPSASPTTRVNFPSGMSPNKWSHIYLGNKNWKRKSGLKFGSFNVGGGYLSKGKILEVEHYMKTQNIDILAVSEIEMNKSKFHQEALYRIKGYTMHLPPSWSSIGKARILLYVKDSIEHHVTLRSDLSPQSQPVIWIQINSNHLP